MIAIFLLVTLSSTLLISAEPWQICGDMADNYTANSRYHANLKHLSLILPKNTSSNDPLFFATGSSGSSVDDTVYGLALCRGDANASGCHTCLAKAFRVAQQRCRSRKQVTIFYDMCVLQFADDESILHIDGYSDIVGDVVNTMNTTDVTNTEPILPGWDPNNIGSITNITRIIKVLLQETAREAVNMAMDNDLADADDISVYATGRMDVSRSFPTLYSMVQCTPDLQPVECSDCLEIIVEKAMDNYFAGKQGGRILAVRCNLRYDTTLFYSGKPTKLIRAPDVIVPPVKAVPSPPAALPAAPPVMPIATIAVLHQKQKNHMIRVIFLALVFPLLAPCFCLIICIRRRKGKVPQDKGKRNVEDDEALDWGLGEGCPELTIYDLSQVLEATDNFSDENKLGQGGFGPVYKGRFSGELETAVKRLASHSGQGFTEFKNEVQLIAKLQHTNLVRLLGCCLQGEEKILIYEYLPNKSLDFFIFDETRRSLLTWPKRLSIIEGIAQGLLYLHKHSRLRVIHRDLKASNILLDCEMKPKISDFGLAKICSTNDIEGNTQRIVGTYGYMAPEYVSEGLFSIKSDVFSFGVLILEIISGIKTSRFHRYGDFINLLGYAWQLWNNGSWLQLVDGSIFDENRASEIRRCVNIALLCVQENMADRPTMSDVVASLSSASMVLLEPKHPAYFNIGVIKEEASIVVEQTSLNEVTVSVLDGR